MIMRNIARIKGAVSRLYKSNQTAAISADGTSNAADCEVLIIGAGIAGIGMASRLQQLKKETLFHTKGKNHNNSAETKRFILLEKRADLGGTWDLFKYPGIRSDSDALTFGYSFKPWQDHRMLAAGGDIKSYIADTAQEFDVARHIRYGHEVQQLSWSSERQLWTATVKNHSDSNNENDNELLTLTANFVVGATGYYDFDAGYRPHFDQEEAFEGQIIHPQKWQDVDYDDKKIVIIGSGATAVTLLPALVDKSSEQRAHHVTMLQRSPTYVASVPGDDYTLDRLSAKYSPLSNQHAYTLLRVRNILRQQGVYQFAKRVPKAMKAVLKQKAKKELKGSGVDIAHFLPHYNPWDERLCAVPDSDLFKALHSSRADIVTDQISHFTKTGIMLESGQHLEADIIVTATGLNLQMLGGAKVEVDGKAVDVGERMTYKATLLEGIPNMAAIFGYTNASWTLKVDLSCHYLLRLFDYMKKHHYHSVVPLADTGSKKAQAQEDTIMGSLSAGYIYRARDVLPKQGDRYPWFVTSNYLKDRMMLKHRKIKDDWLRFDR